MYLNPTYFSQGERKYVNVPNKVLNEPKLHPNITRYQLTFKLSGHLNW